MGFEEIEEIAIYSPQKNTLIQKMCISTNTIKEGVVSGKYSFLYVHLILIIFRFGRFLL